MLKYVWDEKLRQKFKGHRQNYWDTYYREIGVQLGIRAERVSLAELETAGALRGVRVLLLGCLSGEKLPDTVKAAIREWVRQGGLLIGCAPQGLDDVFGVESCANFGQQPDEYAISAYLDLIPHALTHQVHPHAYLEQKLFALSPVRLVKPAGAVPLARLYDTNKNYLGFPAVTWNRFGSGWAGYFAFDLVKTVWLLHQGRPLPDFDKQGKMSLVGDNLCTVPYADELVHLLENMIAQTGQPLVYAIPPLDGQVPDALFYWGGDEYRGPSEMSLKASDWMKAQGLPYHINIEIDNHPLTVDELRHIQANGHEVSLYYHPLPDRAVSRELIREQSDLLFKKFGYRPGSTLLYNTHWQGWVELARWMQEAGGTADNSRGCVNKFLAPHPYANGPVFSFAFGTSYPFHFYDDYRRDNERIDFLEQPIVWYEMGHRGSVPPYDDRITRALDEVHYPIDFAVKYHLVLNVFYHPIYIVNHAPCREAIQETLRYIRECGYCVRHMTNNQAADWWHARERCGVDQLETAPDIVRFRAVCAYPGGMIIKVPIQDREVVQVPGGAGKPAYTVKPEFGDMWVYVIVPAGEHAVELRLQPASQPEERPLVEPIRVLNLIP